MNDVVFPIGGWCDCVGLYVCLEAFLTKDQDQGARERPMLGDSDLLWDWGGWGAHILSLSHFVACGIPEHRDNACCNGLLDHS